MGAGALVASMPIVGPVGAPASPLPQSGTVMSTQGSGDGSSLLALMQNFARRELDWGRLRGAAANVAMLMRTLLGLALVEMELRDQERLTLWAQGQEFTEVRRMMEEELASAQRALEDERKVRMAELNAARQTLDDVHAQSVVVATELKQLHKERGELRSRLQTAMQERDAALQERDAAV
ncbi:hypothetical protein PVAP13_4KG244205 [Panicum virgatum]|uniref:Uncharacterized protein n=1 Tax=Panicum virgatum TaxID=38727 RepID=A0A8T0TW10_PANVG|nr:hypothetical protein PVAP13_4KG244205 [Panicum virgatum]